jgi:LacI family repressor for deo operon, udp, cdd, tsx, nupC, and nupG
VEVAATRTGLERESQRRQLRPQLHAGPQFREGVRRAARLAFGAMQALRAHKLEVPADVSVVGFDDIRYSRHAHPPLTTIAQPKFELGGSAMASLLEILADANVRPYKRIFPTELVVRGSTGPCPGRRPARS